MENPVPVYVRGRGIVGRTKKGRYLTVRTSDTFFGKFRGFGISFEALDQVLERGCNEIWFFYNGKIERSVYKIRVVDFVSKSAEYTDLKNGGRDRQLICPISEMTKVYEEGN